MAPERHTSPRDSGHAQPVSAAVPARIVLACDGREVGLRASVPGPVRSAQIRYAGANVGFVALRTGSRRIPVGVLPALRRDSRSGPGRDASPGRVRDSAQTYRDANSLEPLARIRCMGRRPGGCMILVGGTSSTHGAHRRASGIGSPPSKAKAVERRASARIFPCATTQARASCAGKKGEFELLPYSSDRQASSYWGETLAGADFGDVRRARVRRVKLSQACRAAPPISSREDLSGSGPVRDRASDLAGRS